MKQVAVLSAALVAALVGSYVTWTAEETEVTDDAVPIYTAAEKELAKIAWKGEEQVVVVERRKDAHGEYLWVDTTEIDKPKVPADDVHAKAPEGAEQDAEAEEAAEAEQDAGEAPDPAPAAEPEAPAEEKRSAFLANSQGQDIWKSFAPLLALRELDASAIDRAAVGLTEPTATLEIARDGGAPIVLTVGGETYGSKDRYVEHDGRIFLVDDATLRPLQFAHGRLIERSLFPLSEKETDRVDVTMTDGRTVSYVQQHKDDATKAFWSKPDAPETEDEAGATWIGKVFRLKLREYVDESTITTPLQPVVTYSVSGDGQTWKIELLKSSAEPTQWYARTEYGRSLATLTESLARNVVDDLDTIGTP